MFSKVVWLQVRKTNPGVLFYKTSFYEESFKSINLNRNTRKWIPFPEQLPALTNGSKSISTQKRIIDNEADSLQGSRAIIEVGSKGLP
jgi:hypothetical protein